MSILCSDDVSVKNVGLVNSSSVGIAVSHSDNVRVDNIGSVISGSQGIRTDGDGQNVRVFNSGSAVGETTGVSWGGESGLVVNSGTISGDLHGITGTFWLYSETLHIRNSGEINGDVLFSAGADLYVANGTGLVSGTVFGAGGRDTLIGGTLDDRFVGGRAGDDILQGGVRRDVIVGGAGHDRIAGGADDDVLTGSGGADVFVFGPGGGTDTITDFVQARDRIEISGHAGGFDGLIISDGGTDLSVPYDGRRVILSGHAELSLTLGDFELL